MEETTSADRGSETLGGKASRNFKKCVIETIFAQRLDEGDGVDHEAPGREKS